MVTYTEKEFDTTNVDKDKVKELSKYADLIDALNSWITFPDRTLAVKLTELSLIVKQLYTFDDRIKLYRGVGNTNLTASLGIEVPELGKDYKFESPNQALSFSSDIEIAKGYAGRFLIEVEIDKMSNFLVVTPELDYLICSCNNSKHKTQKEVIVLPPINITPKVIEIKGKPLLCSW
jgi:hypothetical protein